MPEAIISIRNVSSAYVSRNFGLFGKKAVKPVLHNVGIDIYAGEIFGLTGESGCGKTTLARCILGLAPFDGEITVNGYYPMVGGRGAPPRRDRKYSSSQVQMIFQDPGASLNPARKIGWLLEEPLVISRVGTAQQRARRVDAMLERVGLDVSCKTRRVNELSGGQKQRACIGRALMLDSKILIADEAISALDVSVGAQILNLFRELRESLGLTILFISHNTDAVDYLCDRVALMQDGTIVNII